MTAVGIDLGTTNSALAVWKDGAPQLIRNALGQPLTPSVVGLDPSGEIAVGEIAKDRRITHPTQCVAQFKRWMGTGRETVLGRHRFRPEELSALVLKSLMADLDVGDGDAPVRTVISVPAYFSDPQRKATLSAARLAGLAVDRLVNEPTAAALAYGLNEHREGKFVVLDLGGGTFDVTVLDKYAGVMEVLASAGDSWLGGEDFTDALAYLLLDRHGLTAEALEAQQLGRLRRFAETAKCALSAAHERDYQLDLEGAELSGTLTRSEFEAAVRDLASRLRLPIERAIRDSAVETADIDQIVLVGGATRMPIVRSLVSRLFGRIPLASQDPDTIVAMGAAAMAAMLARDQSLEEVVMTDVCPYTLGTAVIEGGRRAAEEVMSTIIERNAVVPISRVERYFTAASRQTQVTIRVFQGEQLRPRDNVKIGELAIAVPPGPAGREACDVRFTYDSNGALEVEVTVVSTGETATDYFHLGSGTLTEDEIAARFAALKKLKQTPREQLPNRALIARAERLYAESDSELRQIIMQTLTGFIDAIEDQRNRTAERDREDFRRFLSEVEKRLFGSVFPDGGWDQ